MVYVEGDEASDEDLAMCWRPRHLRWMQVGIGDQSQNHDDNRRLTITMTMTCTIFSQGQAREQRMPLLLKVCFGLWLPFNFWFFSFHWFFHGQVDWWEELHSGEDGSVLVWGRHLLSNSPGLEIDFEAEQVWKKILLFVQKWANAIDIKCSLFVSNLNQCQLNLNLEYNSNFLFYYKFLGILPFLDSHPLWNMADFDLKILLKRILVPWIP